MIDYRNIIKNRELRLKIINCLRFIPTPLYLKIVFFIKTGHKLNLKNPKTFCDKQNYLKIHEIHPEYTDLVDKIKVRDVLYEKLGKDICIPLCGVWESYDDIDFDELPDKFVLKCSHDSGSVTVVRDKSKLDHKKLRKFYNGRLKLNPYVLGREYPYKDVVPKIMAEKYMEQEKDESIQDYKFFCFDGVPKMMFVASDREKDMKFDFFDMDFNHLDIKYHFPNSEKKIEKPKNFEYMKQLASQLSEGIKFVRIDLYEINDTVYFGEFTLFHSGGFAEFPPKWDAYLADSISL